MIANEVGLDGVIQVKANCRTEELWNDSTGFLLVFQ